VGKRFDSFFDRPWRPAELRQTRLIVIGKDLDAAVIRAAIVNDAPLGVIVNDAPLGSVVNARS
jgi:cobalamin biosynthesis protein CobW